jgi:hypothetical protein
VRCSVSGTSESRRSEKQCSEVRRLADNVSSCVHPIDLGREGASCQTTVKTVLDAPRRTFVGKVEAESAPGMTEEVVDRSKPVERATELTIEERMKALANDDG